MVTLRPEQNQTAVSDFPLLAAENPSFVNGLVEASRDAIIGETNNGIVVAWNQAAVELFGYTAEEMIGKPTTELVPSALHHEWEDVRERARLGENVPHYETRRQTKAGALVDVSISIAAIRHHGECVGFSNIVRCCQDRNREQARLSYLSAIVASSHDAIFGRDMNGVITSWNDGAMRRLGYTAAEIIGMPGTRLIPPELHEADASLLAQVRLGHSIHDYRSERRHRYGTLIPVMLSLSPIRNRDGVIIGTSEIARDVSEQTIVENERRSGELRFRGILEAAADAIVCINSKGIITVFNRAACEMFGYTTDEVIGRNITILMPAATAAHHDAYLARYMATGVANVIGIGREVKAQRKDGSTFDGELSVCKAECEGGVEFCGIVRDVTARRESENELRKYATDLEITRGRLEEVVAQQYLATQEAQQLRDAAQQSANLQQQVQKILYESADERMFQDVLELTLRELSSRAGVLGYLDDHGHLVVAAETGQTGLLSFSEQLPVSIPPEKWSGPWGEVLQQRKTRIQLLAYHTRTNGLPWFRSLGTPIVHHGRLIGLLLITNKPGDYTQRDVEKIEQIACLVTPVLAARLEIIRRERAEKELMDTRDAALLATRAKSEFLAKMSHEIRTPMSAILGFAEILADDLSNMEHRELLGVIRRNGEHLLELINDILDISKVESGRVELRIDRVPVRQLLHELMETMRPHAEEKGLQLVLNIDSSVPQLIHSDPTRLRQILMNLLSNAVKFTNHGSVVLAANFVRPPSVLTGVHADDSRNGIAGQLVVDVCDTGRGMNPQQVEKLFVAFSQADSSVTRQFGGTGLGLFISRNLARMLGGDVTVLTAPEQGSTFTMTVAASQPLSADVMQNSPVVANRNIPQPATGPTVSNPFFGVPVETHHPSTAAVATATSAATSSHASVGSKLDQLLGGDLQPQEFPTAEPPRNKPARSAPKVQTSRSVLLVEDGRDNQRLASTILRAAGHTVTIVENGRLAIDEVTDANENGSPYEVILMDMQMPVMDGYTATEKLREMGVTTPIVALTAHAMQDDCAKCLAAGCDEYLSKPFSRSQLLAMIDVCNEIRRNQSGSEPRSVVGATF